MCFLMKDEGTISYPHEGSNIGVPAAERTEEVTPSV